MGRNINYVQAQELYQKDRSRGKVIVSPRMFGVELEMVSPYKNYEIIDSENDARNALLDKTMNVLDKSWGWGRDGSVTAGGIEIQTPPMMLSAGENAVAKAVKSLSDLGWSTDNSCGVHVHLNAKDIRDNPDIVRRLFLTYFVLDYSILAMLPINRRNNVYCAPLDATKSSKLLRYGNTGYKKGFKIEDITTTKPTKKEFLEMYYKKPLEQIPREIQNHYNEARYHGINFHPLFGTLGTVEIRYLEGTLNADDIINWIALHQHIVDSARKIRDKEALDLFYIKGPKTRMREFAKITDMPIHILKFAEERIDRYKNIKK